MQEDLEVTGISRSGRVRKKSSKLMDFESPDDIETRFRRQTPVKPYTGFKHEETQEFQAEEPATPRRVEEAPGTASGSESDYYENTGENADSMDTDSSASDEGSTRTPANSLYMMEKSSKKKLIVKDGRVVGRAKAQRKDKGKTRITAYMMWAKEARNELLRKHPDMDFSAISKRLGEMWSNVNYNERYLWKRKAKRFTFQKEQSNQVSNKIISNPRGGIPTENQMEVFLDFLNDHPDLANSKLRGIQGRIRARSLWYKITNKLNSMEGCQKSIRQWQRVWADKKYLIKKTFTTRRLEGGDTTWTPSKMEEIVLAIIKKKPDHTDDRTMDSSNSDEDRTSLNGVVPENLSNQDLPTNQPLEVKEPFTHVPGIPTQEQLDVLLDFLYEHRDLANNKLRGIQGRILARSLWIEIVNKLNSMPGCQKSVQKWQKVWADRKYLTRKAYMVRQLKGANSIPPPSRVEEKILNIIEKKTIDTEDKTIDISDSSSDNSTSAEMPSRCQVFLKSVPDGNRSSSSSRKSEPHDNQTTFSRVLQTPDLVPETFEDRTLKIESKRNDELAGIKTALVDLCGIMREAVEQMRKINNRFDT